jgi:uncharacterized protein (TIGR02996 family)
MRKKDEKAAFEKAIEEDPYDGTTHKVFADWLEEHGFDDEALLQREWTPEKMRAAEKWMKEYAAACSEPDYYELTVEKLIDGAHRYLDTGAGLCIGIDTPDVVYDSSEDFWVHFMVLTGRPVPSEKRGEVFIHCAC